MRKLVLMSSAIWFAVAGTAFAGTDVATVGMTATVDATAEWADASPTIATGDWTGSVDGTTVSGAGEDLTVTKALTLYSNATVTLTQAGTTNSGILTNATTDTLTTSYQIRGDVGTPDGAYKAAGTDVGQFFNASNTYTVTHTNGDGSYAIDLWVKGESDDAAISDAGSYTASLTITATW